MKQELEDLLTRWDRCAVDILQNMTTWTMGANRSAVEADAVGELPEAHGCGRATARTPVGALAWTGLIPTAVLVVSALFIDTQDSLFSSVQKPGVTAGPVTRP